jgi:replicative DNA helicase
VNVRDYASAVRRHWLVRRTIAEAQKIAYEGYAPVGDVEAWLAGVSRRVSEIVDDSVERPTTTADVGSTSAVSGICAASKRPGISGVRTWLKALDEATAGMHPRDLILLTAETGGGKTALAVTIGQNVASAGGGVLMFSLEMPQDQVYSRMLAREARVNWHRMRLGKSSAAEFGRVFDARKVIAPLPMLVEDRRNMTTQMMASIIRRERARLRRRGIELCVIIVDYIQKVYGQDLVPPRSTREREMARVAEELIRLAEREAIPLIALAQTNDDGLVRESRAILMEATAWWHIEGVRGDGTPGPRAARIEIKKQRHGPFPITAACWFHPEYVFFSDSDRPEWDAQMRASGEATEVENEQRREEQAPPATGRTHQEPLPTVSPTDVFNDDGP